MKNFLSRYHFSYPRKIVFMLQSVEYRAGDFWKWYRRVKNFSKLESRHTLDKTVKARILLISAWFILYLFYVDAFISLFSGFLQPSWLVFILEILIAPYLLPYLIFIPLFILNLIQKPVEQRIVARAKDKIKTNNSKKIAIVGSYGKTTMREILHSILSVKYKVAKAKHNHNTILGISKFINTLEGDEDFVIFEFGEYKPGDIRKMAELTGPDIAFVTGINEAHLVNFKTTDKTVEEIFSIKEFVDDKLIYVNAENDLSERNSPKESIEYARSGVKNFKVENASSDMDGTKFTILYDGNSQEVKTDLLGLHQLGPISGASHFALNNGLNLSEVKNGIENLKPFMHRLEKHVWKNDVQVLDDSYNGNPDGVKAVIEFLSNLHGFRKWYVTPGLVEMGDKTEQVHKVIGKRLADAEIDKVVLIQNSVTPLIYQGLTENNFKGEVMWFSDMPKVIESLPNMTVEKDVVLIQNDWPEQYE